MAQVPFVIPEALFPNLAGLNEEQQEVLRMVSDAFESFTRQLQLNMDTVNQQIGFGVAPGDENEVGVGDNIQGTWHTVKFTGAGNILGEAVVVTHNQDLPVVEFTTPASTSTMPNVRWLFANWHVGDRTDDGGQTLVNEPPGTNFVEVQSLGFNILHVQGDPVTRNSITLRFYSEVAPSSAEPIYVDFFLVPAVR